MFIVCNWLLPKAKKEQYYCDLAHGCALKNATKNNYSVPKACSDADVLTISNYMAKYDAHNLNCDVNCMKALGYPRNDDLFNNIDLHKYFCNINFNKAIYWLPTYRQNKWGNAFHSDISMPIIHNEKTARSINEYAKKNKVLIIVKVHPAQDISKISEFNYSNLIFIKNDFFDDKDITNYQLLGSCDALISDYSSVYYDYLLTDKPIGLCFEDFDEYNKREGFTMDPNFILAGGVKIYNCDDMCSFINDIANGNDVLKNKRNEIKNLVHSNADNQSTKRVVDYFENVVL
jgi:CDP-glycerol glycerophosphotransferase (TagB/SpsB family)